MEKIRIAFAGRTRSGKSTLINALLGDDACNITAAVDTTDKVHKLAAGEDGGQSGIYLFDTPGVGGEESYEGWTRAYLGLPSIQGDQPQNMVPICRVDREKNCPYAITKTWNKDLSKRPNSVPERMWKEIQSMPEEATVTLPRAFQAHRSPGGDSLQSCRDQGCQFFLPIPFGNPELDEERPDLLLYLVRAQSGGLAKEDRKFLEDLRDKYSSGRIVALLTCIDDEVDKKGIAEVLSKIADQNKIPFMAMSVRTGEGMDRLRRDLFYRLASEASQALKRTNDTIEQVLLRNFPLRIDFFFDSKNNELRLFPFGAHPRAELRRDGHSHEGTLVVERSGVGISKINARFPEFQWGFSEYIPDRTSEWKIEIRCSPALQPSRFAHCGYWSPSELKIHDGDRWHERKARRPE